MTPQFSIFTPTHKPEFLPAAYESLKAQACDDWEWVIVPNGGASIPNEIAADKRVRVLDNLESQYVGALKRRACAEARGEILVELDHDDLLTCDALAELRGAYEDEKVGFVYSNAVHCDLFFNRVPRFGDGFGWQYDEVALEGHMLDSPRSFDPAPESISRIWYAPNHVRSFRRKEYEKVGGYSDAMRVLDDQDLMSRLYINTEFKHIPKPLYIYRIHGKNTWLEHNNEIQNNVYRIYSIYIEAMAKAWASRRGLRSVELGGRFGAKPGYETVDLHSADVCCDLNGRWPFEDSSIGVVRAFDIFEHLPDPLHTMKELYRVLAPGGFCFAQVPSTDGRGAFQDPTHKSFWNENSWLYYTHQKWARYLDTPVRFQSIHSFTTQKDDHGVCWAVAHLVSLKNGYRPAGVINI